MGVKRQPEPSCECSRLLHQAPGDRERRAGSDRDLDTRACARLVESAGQALGLGEHRVELLHEVVGREAAVGLPEIHRSARCDDAEAELAGGLDLGLDQTLTPAREHVVVVEDRRAAGESELRESGARRCVLRFRVEARPDRIELTQPGEEVGLLRAGARERLEEVVVGVDEPGRDERALEVDRLLRRRWRSLPGRADESVLDQHPAGRVLGSGVVHHDEPGVRVDAGHTRRGTSSKRSTSTRPWSVILRLGITDSARKESDWNGDDSSQPSARAASTQPRLAATTS
jgi:hypothetical protein